MSHILHLSQGILIENLSLICSFYRKADVSVYMFDLCFAVIWFRDFCLQCTFPTNLDRFMQFINAELRCLC